MTQETTNGAIIKIRGLKQSYDKTNLVLQGIDLDIYPGQIIGYIGPNGAGKTTTVKILIGMLSDFEGQVNVRGYDMSQQPAEVKKHIGYVPENAAMYEVLTPMEYLLFIGQLYRMPEELIKERGTQMLTLLGLENNIDNRMTGFSKGMKQKVLITAGLLHNPDIVFLDEPLSGLDANMAIVIKEILTQLAAQGKTIFYCSHIMDVVERISDRIVLIDQGKIIADAPFAQLQSMNKGESLEKIFTQLTGNTQHAATAGEFVKVFEGGAS